MGSGNFALFYDYSIPSSCQWSLLTIHLLLQSYEAARCTDASQYAQPPHHKAIALASYGFKVFALYKSSFDKVFLLDADNMPFIAPDRLFTEDSFLENGNMFWRDYTQREGLFVVQPEGEQSQMPDQQS